MYYVYVLKSTKDGRLYTGMTQDLSKRIKAHNYGKVKSTKGRRPFKLVHYQTFESKTEALKRELFFKSGQGRKYLESKLHILVD